MNIRQLFSLVQFLVQFRSDFYIILSCKASPILNPVDLNFSPVGFFKTLITRYLEISKEVITLYLIELGTRSLSTVPNILYITNSIVNTRIEDF